MRIKIQDTKVVSKGKFINCKGCFVNNCCPLTMINETQQSCPCTKCLVKMTCEISCPEYDLFEDNLYKDGYQRYSYTKSNR